MYGNIFQTIGEELRDDIAFCEFKTNTRAEQDVAAWESRPEPIGRVPRLSLPRLRNQASLSPMTHRRRHPSLIINIIEKSSAPTCRFSVHHVNAGAEWGTSTRRLWRWMVQFKNAGLIGTSTVRTQPSAHGLKVDIRICINLAKCINQGAKLRHTTSQTLKLSLLMLIRKGEPGKSRLRLWGFNLACGVQVVAECCIKRPAVSRAGWILIARGFFVPLLIGEV
ncbi:hypothetical protein C8R44DRAFT_861323 [Mycena epipterygia]|nr:hypothetical protein C8R44DRAFT_861323 [Mycena epipterygia]